VASRHVGPRPSILRRARFGIDQAEAPFRRIQEIVDVQRLLSAPELELAQAGFTSGDAD
jgi:hypothetical protein